MEAHVGISFFPASEPTLLPSCYSIPTLSCQASYPSSLTSQESHLFSFPKAILLSQTSQYNIALWDVALLSATPYSPVR